MDVDSFISKLIFEEKIGETHNPYLWRVLFSLAQCGYAHPYPKSLIDSANISIKEQTHVLDESLELNSPLEIDVNTLYTVGFRLFVRNKDFFSHIYVNIDMYAFSTFAHYLQVDYNNVLSKLLIKKTILFLLNNCLFGRDELLPEFITISSNGAKIKIEELLNLE